MSQAASQVQQERRAAERTHVKLLGRYMLPDQCEYKCSVLSVSLNGISLAGAQKGNIGDTVIVYIDKYGRVEGKIVRHFDEGFALELDMAAPARNKWAERIANIDGEQSNNTQRRDARAEPEDKNSRFTLPDGRSYSCKVIDVSISGASIQIGVFPAIGTPVQLGKMRGKVVRHHAEGVAIEFVNVPETGTLADRFSNINT